jgi:Ribbon-helix-helix protein, copG family
MKKSTGKKRMGRPPTGRTPVVALTLPKQALAKIDKIAKERRTTKAAIIREIVLEALTNEIKPKC